MRLTPFVLLIVCGGLAACGADDKPAASAPAVKVQSPVKESELTTLTLTEQAEQRLGVQTAVVERRSLPGTRNVGGEIIAPPGAETQVTAPFAGTIDAPGGVPAAGSPVAKGRTILRLVSINPAERDAHVEAERLGNEAVVRQDAATRKVRRAETLLKDGAGSRRALEEAQAELAVADTDVKAARERLALAVRSKVTPDGILLESPFPAVLRNVYATVGQTVAAGAPLFDLLRFDTVWVRVPLYVGEFDEIDSRAPATIVQIGSAADAPGRVARPISAPPSADPSTAAVDLYFALTNTDAALRPGQRVGVRLTRRGQTESLVVPARGPAS